MDIPIEGCEKPIPHSRHCYELKKNIHQSYLSGVIKNHLNFAPRSWVLRSELLQPLRLAQLAQTPRSCENTSMLRILLTNDDGVFAKGLAVLADTLNGIAQINVVAPDRNRSGASNSLTLTAPMRVKYLENEMISVEGTPTDCVHIAVTGLLPRPPDMVVSGINAGANLGMTSGIQALSPRRWRAGFWVCRL